jgi:hypothetical protein
MDPFVESPTFWGDIHAALIASIRAELNRRLPPRYVAEMELYVWIHEPDAEARRRLRKPDVYVKDNQPSPANGSPVSTVAASQNIILPAVAMEGNKYVKILDADDHRVVTGIEILSPANKAAGEQREAYLAKWNQYLASRVNLVEIDLLRAGERLPLGDPVPVLRDYYVMTCRAAEMPRAGFWSFGVRDPMPDIPVPLDADAPDVTLPLRTCFDRAYDEGRYTAKIKYAQPMHHPLSDPDAEWARELLREMRAPRA